ncbi:MAG: potassium channel family protein [Methanomicrobiales archaeon]
MNEKLKKLLERILQVYLTIVISLMVVDVTLLIILTFFVLKPANVISIYNFDLIVCLLLFFSILVTLIPKKDRIQFIKTNWISILAIIPFDFIFLGLLGFNLSIPLSILRIIHIIALIKTIGKIGSNFVKFSKKTGLNYGIGILTVIFLLSSTAFLIAENNVNPEVKTYEDSAWYTVTTMTTTGYGDIVPITLIGRILGVIMMVTGVAFTGYATASVASMLIDKFREEKDKDREIFIKTSEKMNIEREKAAEDIKTDLKEILDKLDKK